MSEILAAFLYAQLQAVDEIQSRRKAIWERYRKGLGGWAQNTGVRLPAVPVGAEQSYHMFYVILPTPAARSELIAQLDALGISAVSHYVPLHLSRMGRQGGVPQRCPVTEQVCDRLLRLPFHNNLSTRDVDRVVGAIISSAVAA